MIAGRVISLKSPDVHSHRVARIQLLLLGSLVLGGCGDGRPETIPVRGRITWNGSPVSGGRIMFYPEHGRPAMGVIGSDGHYSLDTFEPGRHRVTIHATQTAESGGPKSFAEELSGVSGVAEVNLQWLVPEEYSRRETTPLTAEVVPEHNTIDFDLPL